METLKSFVIYKLLDICYKSVVKIALAYDAI